jgi:hypothetical protein
MTAETGCDCTELCEACAEVPVEIAPVPQGYNFNPDENWQRYVAKYRRSIEKIATKYCVADEALRDDVMQEAHIALATVYPETVHGFEDFVTGVSSDDTWAKALDRYCHNVIRNAILSYLDSYAKGNWYIGRTRYVKDKRTGETRKVYLPPRFSSLDELVDDHGMQVDEHGALSWPDPSDDGLISAAHSKALYHNYGKAAWYDGAVETAIEAEAVTNG